LNRCGFLPIRSKNPNHAQTQRQRYASCSKGKRHEPLANPLPTSRLLLPIRLKSVVLLLRRIPTSIRSRRLVSRRLLRVVPERHSVTTRMRALNALISRPGLAQAHDRAPASFVALGLGVPEAALTLAVAAVVRVVAAGTAADGAQPEEGRDDGEGGCDPGYGEGAGAEADFDVVGLEEGVQGAGQGGEEDCGGEGGEEGEQG
jgi:hypothetical protein